MIDLSTIDLVRDYRYLGNFLIRIYNPETEHYTMTRSIFEIPEGYYIVKRKPFSKESRQKMSESAKKRGTPECAYRSKKGEENPMYGKKQSEETKRKISESMKKRKNLKV